MGDGRRSSYTNTGFGECGFHGANVGCFVVEDSRQQRGLSTTTHESISDIARAAGATGRHHRNGDGARYSGRELDVVAGTRAIAIDAGEKDLARAELRAASGPINGVDAGRLPP